MDNKHYNADNDESEDDFKKLFHTIATNLQKIHQNVSSMQRMVIQFGTVQDSQELMQQLYRIRPYTQQLIKDTDNLLKVSGNCKDRHIKIQYDRLVDEFTSALISFQGVQSKIIDFEKISVEEAHECSENLIAQSPSYNNETFMLEKIFIDNKIISETKKQIDEFNLKALQEQQRIIKDLEEDIIDVNEMCIQLNGMIHAQTGLVIAINSPVEATKDIVENVTKKLREVNRNRNKLRIKILIICLILVVIIIALISAIIVNVFRTEN